MPLETLQHVSCTVCFLTIDVLVRCQERPITTVLPDGGKAPPVSTAVLFLRPADKIRIRISNRQSGVKSIFSAEIAFPWCIGPRERNAALDMRRGHVYSFQELSLQKSLDEVVQCLCRCSVSQMFVVCMYGDERGEAVCVQCGDADVFFCCVFCPAVQERCRSNRAKSRIRGSTNASPPTTTARAIPLLLTCMSEVWRARNASRKHSIDTLTVRLMCEYDHLLSIGWIEALFS